MAEPTDSDIQGVCGICDLDPFRDRALVIGALKAKNNNLEAVIGEFFDDANKFRQQYSWDESAFSTGRDEDANAAGISFNIHSPDENPIIHGVDPGNSFIAPSRPPSRATNNRSPLGRMIDWTANGAAGAPMSRAQEDEDFQKALAASRAESGVASPQEAGIILTDTSQKAFGPANRDDYDQNQWAMVPIRQEAAEPPPSSRKREGGAPAFLRCRKNTQDKNRIGTLLTVFHEIPAARNVLLNSGLPADSYGHNNAWWRGQAIVSPHIQAARDRGELSWVDDADPDFSEELHRLMAFLDSSDRSYGTADVLADLKIMGGGGWDGSEYEPTFLRILKETNGNSKTRALWTYLKVASLQEAPDADDSESLDEYGMLDLKVPDGQVEGVTSLYNLWDLLYWIEPGMSETDDDEPSKIAYITQAPEVLTMRINGAVPSIDIPETFYLDRYMESNKWKAATLQRKICRVYNALSKFEANEHAVTKWTSQDGKQWDRSVVINKAIELDEKQIHRVKGLALWRKHEECNASGDPFPYLPNLPAQIDQLAVLNEQERTVIKHYQAKIDINKQQLADIDSKLKRLISEKKACSELLQRLNGKLTVPSGDIHWNPVHEYSLRGVAASPDTVYIRRRAEPDLIDMEGTSAAPVDQWWKLAYVVDDADPIKVEKTQVETVLREALTASEDKKPILVYASEIALAEEPVNLRQPLQLFAKFDNRLFKQELIEESPLERKRGANASPQSPFKRQHRDRANSMDSMASNRASVGDFSDDGRNAVFEQDPFQNGDGSMGTEMQPLIDMSDLQTQQAPTAPAEPLDPSKAEDDSHARLPTPPYSSFDSGTESPTLNRQSLRLANVSLDENNHGSGNSEPQARGPEMQERTMTSFLTRSDKRSVDNRASIMDLDMEIPSEVDQHHSSETS